MLRELSVLTAVMLSGGDAVLPPIHAQRPSENRLAFEVVSIKEGDPRNGIQVNVSGRRFTWENIPLNDVISVAYRIADWQLSGAPDWIHTQRFTIQALAPEGAAIRKFPFQDERLAMMLQSLLEDRFKLKFHWQTKESSIYALVPGRKGAKLKPAVDEGSEDPNQRTGMSWRRGLLTGKRASMADLTRALSNILERPVLDKTGLTGVYDFMVEYSRTGEDGQSSLFSAIEEQIGLRLESQKGPAQMFVIDHVERPAAN